MRSGGRQKPNGWGSNMHPNNQLKPSGLGGPGGPPLQWHHQPSSSKVTNIQINFGGYNRYWTPSWYARYPHAWHPYWITPYHWWYRPTWEHTCTWFAAHLLVDRMHPRVYYPYYYGSNVVYRDRIVYIDNVRYVTADEFYDQARYLANRVEPSDTVVSESASDWLTLGTFGIFKDDGETDTGLLFQLAADKHGFIHGNLVDQADDTVWLVYGSVDPDTQRVAFRLADDDELVYECGLWNLTQDTAPMLVHFDAETTEQRTLIRLVDPTEGAAEEAPPVIRTVPLVRTQSQVRQPQPRQQQVLRRAR